MFGLFKSKKKEIKITQFVWKNETAKYKGLLNSIAGKENVLFLYYFNDTKTELQTVIEKYQSETNNHQRIKIEQASKLLSSFTDLSNTYICFTEHHPSFIKEDNILQHLQDTCSVNEVYFHVSLDDPLFQHFGSENILQLLNKMGLAEDEAMEHSLILKSVFNMQKKIDEKTGSNAIESNSAKDWFELNIRNT